MRSTFTRIRFASSPCATSTSGTSTSPTSTPGTSTVEECVREQSVRADCVRPNRVREQPVRDERRRRRRPSLPTPGRAAAGPRTQADPCPGAVSRGHPARVAPSFPPTGWPLPRPCAGYFEMQVAIDRTARSATRDYGSPQRENSRGLAPAGRGLWSCGTNVLPSSVSGRRSCSRKGRRAHPQQRPAATPRRSSATGARDRRTSHRALVALARALVHRIRLRPSIRPDRPSCPRCGSSPTPDDHQSRWIKHARAPPAYPRVQRALSPPPRSVTTR